MYRNMNNTFRSNYYKQEESNALEAGVGRRYSSNGGYIYNGTLGDELDDEDITEAGEQQEGIASDAVAGGCCSLIDTVTTMNGMMFQCGIGDGLDTTKSVIDDFAEKTATTTEMTGTTTCSRIRGKALKEAANTQEEPSNTRLKSSQLQIEDRHTFMKKLAEDGTCLNDAPEAYKADKEIALVAVSQNGRALQYVSPNMQADKDVAIAAIRQYYPAFYLASKELWKDKDVMLAAVSHRHSSALSAATKTQKNDTDIMTAAVRHNGHMLGMASKDIQNNKHVVIIAVTDQGEALKYASDGLRADKDVVIAAIKTKPSALKYALGGLNQDRDCWIAAGLVVPADKECWSSTKTESSNPYKKNSVQDLQSIQKE